ncbi:cation efflux protein [Umbelopsis sp. PMI_123]|nr:cation efflux protein [Umbelopsis sp. PMI_123]
MFIARPIVQRSLGQLCIRPYYSQVPKIILCPRRNHYTHHHHGHGHDHAHAQLMQTIAESGKRGSRITVIGLAANVGLTVSKGVAGWMMNSASLLADAGHSLSDMLSDFVTLYTYKKSRKPADALYPYGYGKYETVGSLAVSTLLIGGAIGIGWHSFELMMDVIQVSGVNETASAVVMTASDPNASPASPAVQEVASVSDHHGHALNPNAAWFALISIIVKEWLYRATIKVGREEKSDVLIANAWHHRSDAFSSIVALAAIGGSYAGIPILDPLGGLAVSALILKTGGDIMISSLRELCDANVDQEILDQVEKTILQLKTNKPDIIDYLSVRGRKTGPFYLMDMTLHVNPTLTVVQAHTIEEEVRQSIQHACPEVKEIMIHVHAEQQHDKTV